MTYRRLSLCLAVFGVFAATSAAQAGAAPEPYPTVTWEQAKDNEIRWAQEGRTTAPSAPGVNRDDCTPTVSGAVPIVLLHGYAGDEYRAWGYLGPALANAGLCVYSFSYGGTDAMTGGGNGPLADSAREIRQRTTDLMNRLGAEKVDLIGHSEGGVMAQYVVKTDPVLANRVRSVTAIESPTHGVLGDVAANALATTHALDQAPLPPAVLGLLGGSDVLRELNTGPIAVPGIHYTTVTSTNDPLISIAPNVARIDEPGVDNLVIQSFCPASQAGHNGAVFSPTTAAIVRNALDRSAAHPVPCQDDSTG